MPSDRKPGLIGTCARGLQVLVLSVLAGTMTLEPVEQAYAQSSQRCWALEQELAIASNAPQDNSQLVNIDRAIRNQRRELDKVRQQSQQFDCRKSGFLFFQPRRAPQCSTIRVRMEEMTRNLDSLLREKGGMVRGDDRDPVRQQILRSLGRLDCGPQYRRYAPRNRQQFTLFGDPYGNDQPFSSSGPIPGRRLLGDIITYRTMCVRTCDGYRFPVSFATLPGRFNDDAAKCTSMCPTAETELYVHPNPGGSDELLTSLDGRNYSELPNAWRFRNEVVEGCSCDATTLQLEAANAERRDTEGRVASVGANDAAPAPVPSGGPDTPGGNDGDANSNRPFRDTPTAELRIDFDSANPIISEHPSGTNGRPSTQPSTKEIKTREDKEKPPRDERADYQPRRGRGHTGPGNLKNLQ